MAQNRIKNVTVLGGGTGSYVVLSALKAIPSLDLSAIVAMMDSGGSTGKLRDQMGVLPPGDLRQCLVALSEAPEIWRKLFTYRFENGDLKGHNFGNLFISVLEKITGDYNEVLDEVHYVMQCVGRVYPAILENANIQVKYDTGRIVESEKLLDEDSPDDGIIVEAKAIPVPKANPEAVERLLESDLIIAGPGDLYSSVISLALASGLPDAYEKSHAKTMFIMNLMTKTSQTRGYGAYRHLQDFAQYFKRMPDLCLINTSVIPQSMSEEYAQHGEEVVVNDLSKNGYTGQIIEYDLLDTNEYRNTDHLSSPNAHSIVRHDVDKLTSVLRNVLNGLT